MGQLLTADAVGFLLWLPNCLVCRGTHPFNCEDGCLFDLDQDWTEHVNLKATQPENFKRLKARFAELKKSVDPPSGADDDDLDAALVGGGSFEWAPPAKAAACSQMWANGGFWGPSSTLTGVGQ